MTELEELNLDKIPKEDVIRMFNKAMERGDLKPGKYAFLPEANIVAEESLLSGYKWQVGYYTVHGNIESVRIELLYDKDVHLSDLVESGKATEVQKAIQQKVTELQEKIMSSQTFVSAVENPAPVIDGVKFERLFSLLQQIEKTNEDNNPYNK